MNAMMTVRAGGMSPGRSQTVVDEEKAKNRLFEVLRSVAIIDRYQKSCLEIESDWLRLLHLTVRVFLQ